MLEAIKLIAQRNGKESFIIGKGITSIGRDFFGLSEKRISRSQAEINVTNDSVTIIPRGINPLFKIEDSEIARLDQNTSYTLNNGDILQLCLEEYQYEVQFQFTKSPTKTKSEEWLPKLKKSTNGENKTSESEDSMPKVAPEKLANKNRESFAMKSSNPTPPKRKQKISLDDDLEEEPEEKSNSEPESKKIKKNILPFFQASPEKPPEKPKPLELKLTEKKIHQESPKKKTEKPAPKFQNEKTEIVPPKIDSDEEYAKKLQVEFEEEERRQAQQLKLDEEYARQVMSQPSPERVVSEDEKKPIIDPKDEYVDFPKEKPTKSIYDANDSESEEDVVITNFRRSPRRRNARRRAKDRVDYKRYNQELKKIDSTAADDMEDSSDEFDKSDD